MNALSICSLRWRYFPVSWNPSMFTCFSELWSSRDRTMIKEPCKQGPSLWFSLWKIDRPSFKIRSHKWRLLGGSTVRRGRKAAVISRVHSRRVSRERGSRKLDSFRAPRITLARLLQVARGTARNKLGVLQVSLRSAPTRNVKKFKLPPRCTFGRRENNYSLFPRTWRATPRGMLHSILLTCSFDQF